MGRMWEDLGEICIARGVLGIFGSSRDLWIS
jgi:hypothetical protein